MADDEADHKDADAPRRNRDSDEKSQPARRDHGGEDSDKDDRGSDKGKDQDHDGSGSGGDEDDRDDGKDGGKKKGGDEKKKKKRSPLTWIILGAVLLVAAIAGVWYWLATKDQVSTDDAFTDGRAVQVSPKVAGYVVQLAVTDNQRVRAGDLLLAIDPRDYEVARQKAAAALELAQAQFESARLNLDIARTRFPADLAAAEAQRASAAANAAKARADLARQRAVDPRATTVQQVDAATAAARSADAALAEGDARVKVARLVPQNVATAAAQLKQLQGQMDQARAELAQAELNLTYTRITAPQDGWVTKRNVEQGAFVQVGQALLALVSPEVWVTANFKESQLDRMQVNQKVDIAVDAYPHLKLEGHVDSLQMGSGGRFTAFPPENATGNFVKIVQRVPVKIVIDRGMDPNAPLPLGLSVVPTVYFK